MKISRASIATGLVATAFATGLAACGSDSSEPAPTTAAAPAGAEPAVEKDGVLSIAADPNGKLLYVESTATATAGPVKVEMPNESGVPHNLLIEGTPIATPVISNGVAKASGVLKAGEFEYYCSVPGHREAGMVGTLTVR